MLLTALIVGARGLTFSCVTCGTVDVCFFRTWPETRAGLSDRTNEMILFVLHLGFVGEMV